MRAFASFVILALLGASAWLAWALWAPLSPPAQTYVLLHSGYSTRRIARELKQAGVIRSADAFVLWHYAHPQRSLKAGEYRFEQDANAITIHDRLARGEIYVHTVVIPEGYTLFEIAKAMEAAGLCRQEDFLKTAAAQSTLISDIAPDAQSLEGYLFPNTYEFTRTQSVPEMVAIMVKQFRQVAQQIGLNSDIPKTVIMASIIEKETAVAEARPLVASVYYNRLARKIPLQADPSVIYAELLQGTYSGALHHADLQAKSDYNTYAHAGLPPGPIGNPGRSSLEAALRPAKTDYFYFVADGGGHHRFASSLDEHNRNVAAYRRVAAQRAQ